jgi:hypothetical protein
MFHFNQPPSNHHPRNIIYLPNTFVNCSWNIYPSNRILDILGCIILYLETNAPLGVAMLEKMDCGKVIALWNESHIYWFAMMKN